MQRGGRQFSDSKHLQSGHKSSLAHELTEERIVLVRATDCKSHDTAGFNLWQDRVSESKGSAMGDVLP
jgi:hypothetical protein